MRPKSGTPFPAERGTPPSEREFTGRIRQTLRDELGGSRAAAKSIMRWTGVSDRTARNWLNGASSPSGCHLVRLARESDAVLGVILSSSGRSELALSVNLRAVELALAKASGAVAALRQHGHRPSG